jgi:hypothetical protein
MPPYPGAPGASAPAASNASPIALADPGDYCYVLGQLASTATQLPVNDTNVANEAAPVGSTESSIAVALLSRDSAAPPAVSVEVFYPSAPGSGESIAIQEADTDADAFYITPTNSAYTISSFSSANTARSDLSPTGGKYMRVLRTKGANAVACRVKITRLA